MKSENLQTLAKQGLSLLRWTIDEWKAVEETRLGGARFSLVFPHEIARSARPRSLVLIAVNDDGETALKVGLVRSIQATATFDSRVVFDLVRPITPGSLEQLLAMVTEKSLQNGVTKIKNSSDTFQRISPKLGDSLLRAIAASPDNDAVLQRIASELERPKHFQDARALQQDAVSLALKAFGVKDGATILSLPGGDTSLATVRLLEDAVIEHDARWLPGWSMTDSDLTGRAVFKQGADQLEVFTANKRPLEELFGVDLIYLNRSRGALVMVQYKMMEPEQRTRSKRTTAGSEYEVADDQEWIVPIDTQFTAELARMKKFDQDLSPDGTYRLNSGAFFFKLIKRNAATNAAGIVLSLDHLNHMIAKGAASGPRGGLRISYRTLNGHYLRSDPFVELVRSGYIGTRDATTENLRALIEAALNGGRAVVAAIQSAFGASD